MLAGVVDVAAVESGLILSSDRKTLPVISLIFVLYASIAHRQFEAIQGRRRGIVRAFTVVQDCVREIEAKSRNIRGAYTLADRAGLTTAFLVQKRRRVRCLHIPGTP